jgi:hypothetical protein
MLASFLAGVRVRRLARDDFSWADAIPPLLNGHNGSGPGGGRLAERPPIRQSE